MAADELLERAKAGVVEAQFDLGERYRRQTSLDVDRRRAMLWYASAAEAGHADAQCRFGRVLFARIRLCA